MLIFVSAGEPSGDLHAANLIASIRSKRPDARFAGFGGDKIRAEGAEVVYPLVDLSVMWFLRVLLNINKFFAVLKMADDYFEAHRPDAVVLIDYPGFNWWVAKRAKARGIPVVYYVPPQIWAWAGWRVEKVRKFIDLTLCSLPFEKAWYQARGVSNVSYVGHPYFDELAERVPDEAFVAAERAKPGPLVALLPGSRTQEVTRNLPVMLRAAEKLHAKHPGARFAVAALHDRHKALAEGVVAEGGFRLPLTVESGKTAELIRVAEVATAVSGSVGLELMNEALPTIVVYKLRRFDLLVARRFIKSRFISLVNLLADDEVMPEYLTEHDVSTEVCGHLDRWLSDPGARARASERLAALRSEVAVPGASERAADAILAETEKARYRGPHAAAAIRGVVR